MLIDDSYKNPKAITDTVFKGYDRFSSMMYKEISLALREQRNKSEFSKATVTLNPYNVIFVFKPIIFSPKIFQPLQLNIFQTVDLTIYIHIFHIQSFLMDLKDYLNLLLLFRFRKPHG